MFAVERIGNIISRGVYTVSGPFNPFGGAVDIIVVQQQDGSFKSSPWYVRFGKFQGVLMTKEKVVNISVNEVETNFHMYLDHKGEAYFLRELDGEEGESVFYPSYSGDKRPMKSKSYNYDANQSNLVTQVDVSNGKIVARTSSRGSRFLGLAFGRKSMEENRFQDEEDGIGVVRADSLDYAQIAADLLEVKWSTNLASGRHRKKDKNLQIHGQKQLDSLVDDNMENSLDHLVSHKETGSHDNEMGNSFPFGFQKPEISVGETGVEMSCLRTKHVIVTSTSSESGLEESDELNSEMSRKIDELGVRNADHGENTNGVNSEIPDSAELEACPSKKLDEEQIFNKDVVNVSEKESGADGLQSFVYHDTSESTCTFSGFRNSICQVQDEENVEDEDNMHKFQYSLESVSVPQDFNGDCIPIEEINTSPLDSSEEEQFLFGDLDDFKLSDVKCMESSSSDHEEKENHSSLTPKGIEAVTNSLNLDYESYSSLDKFVQGNSPDDVEDLRQKSRILSSCIKIPRGSKVVGEEVGRTVESLPNLWPRTDDLDTDDHRYSLGHSVDSSSKSSKWILLRKDISNIIKSDTDKEHLLSLAQPTTDDGQILDALKEVLANPAVGDPSTAIPSGGNWRLWPFPFKRSRSMKATQPALDCTGSSDAENGPESTAGMDGEKNVFKPKVNKKKVREITPTSEQLASMNLKEGRNTVTFTFSTAMLGKQQVDARIYLWRWDTHIVISDVDGTITKSDVLGQFMPLVGMDWAQTGVAHLFSAIKENGYQLLFLSARAISQAYHTRQFLFNLKQDGEALPDGPVVISPDGLFPSLFREVIRRAPHEFKIACLEDIKVLFPSDRNPFYAGFGNRDSDEVSYLKVGIPKGKIFIINPKGEVAVNHRIDTKSYTSLHALVDGMFPSMSSSEQEDFNSWNYWKLPPPAIDV